MYGPSYRTTAADRNARMANRERGSFQPHDSQAVPDGPSVASSHRRMSDTRDMSRIPSHVTFHEATGAPPVNSTDVAENISSQFMNSDSLIDLDNDLIERVAQIDMGINCGSRQVNEPMDREGNESAAEISNATEYAEMDEQTFRLNRPLSQMLSYRAASLPPPPPAPHSYPAHAIYPPHLYHTSLPPYDPQPRNTLNKTDHVVIMELLKDIEQTDASDEIKLVAFLKKLMPLFNISPSCQAEIIKLLIPKVHGQLFQLWMESINAKTGWDELHRAILDRFIPPMRRREIELIELERPQLINETFSEYVEHLLSVAFALKTRLSEQDVIEISLSKCRPETRAYFNFSRKPFDIRGLRDLASEVTSAVRAETRYFGPKQSSTFSNSARAYSSRPNNSRMANVAPTHPSDLRTRPTQKITKCFRCNQEGHIARFCKAHLN